VARGALAWFSRKSSQTSTIGATVPALTSSAQLPATLSTEADQAPGSSGSGTPACPSETLATAAASTAIEDPREHAVLSVQLGLDLQQQDDTAGAEDAFQKAIEFDPVYDQGYYFLARLLQRSRRLEEAATVCFNGLIATASPLLRRGLLELDYSCAEIDASLARGALPHARSIPDDPDFPPLPMAGLRERVEAYPWWHSINLGEGVVTPGHKSRFEILREAEAIFAPISVRGRSVADIGAWNGGFTIEAKRRGASRILAIDDYTWSHPHFRGKETFELVMSRLGIEAESKVLDIQEADTDSLGRWQVVLFLGVFYHLLDPIAALKRLAEMTEEALVIETHMDLEDVVKPAMAFYPDRELGGDASNWWAPNRPAMEALLRVFGFPRVLYVPHPLATSNRGIFHAFKSEEIYHAHAAAIAADA